jgi:hypothetical protein
MQSSTNASGRRSNMRGQPLARPLVARKISVQFVFPNRPPPSMDDTYAKLRAKYERMRAEGSCEVFPTARPELVESESSTERAFGRCM